jgi:hypothetical protein
VVGEWVFRCEEAREAYEYLEAQKHVGKVGFEIKTWSLKD